MKTVILLSSCNQWHNPHSISMIGVFSTLKTLVGYLKKYDTVSEYDIELLSTIKQTQGRKTNYFIEELKVNPKGEEY